MAKDNDTKYKCCKCNFTGYGTRSIKGHVTQHHILNKDCFVCSACSSSFRDFYDRVDHQYRCPKYYEMFGSLYEVVQVVQKQNQPANEPANVYNITITNNSNNSNSNNTSTRNVLNNIANFNLDPVDEKQLHGYVVEHIQDCIENKIVVDTQTTAIALAHKLQNHFVSLDASRGKLAYLDAQQNNQPVTDIRGSQLNLKIYSDPQFIINAILSLASAINQDPVFCLKIGIYLEHWVKWKMFKQYGIKHDQELIGNLLCNQVLRFCKNSSALLPETPNLQLPSSQSVQSQVQLTQDFNFGQLLDKLTDLVIESPLCIVFQQARDVGYFFMSVIHKYCCAYGLDAVVFDSINHTITLADNSKTPKTLAMKTFCGLVKDTLNAQRHSLLAVKNSVVPFIHMLPNICPQALSNFQDLMNWIDDQPESQVHEDLVCDMMYNTAISSFDYQ